jgi:hypothetical protein
MNYVDLHFGTDSRGNGIDQNIRVRIEPLPLRVNCRVTDRARDRSQKRALIVRVSQVVRWTKVP